MLEKTLESPLDCKEIQPVHSEGDQPWDFFGRNAAKAETPVLWPPHSAMRVGPVGLAFDSLERVLAEAERSAGVSHDHPEGIRGAQAVALAVFLAARGADKRAIRSEIENRLGYRLDRPVSEIRLGYQFDESCQGSVPESITCFLESEDFESAVRLAVSLGGDADTMACIAGAIAEPFYGGVPADVAAAVRGRLSTEL